MGICGAQTLWQVQIPAGMAPGSQHCVETSEREKLMGIFCQGNEENKKPAPENRTGKRPPSTGMRRALRQPAHMQGTAGLGSRSSRGTKTCGPAVPGPTLIKEAEAGKKTQEGVETAGAGAETQQDGYAASCLHGPTTARDVGSVSVDRPVPGV